MPRDMFTNTTSMLWYPGVYLFIEGLKPNYGSFVGDADARKGTWTWYISATAVIPYQGDVNSTD